MTLRIDNEYVSATNPLPVTSTTTQVAYNDYETLTVSTTATYLTRDTFEEADKALITVEAGAVRFRLDGTAPTTTVGHLLNVGDQLILDSIDQLQRVQFISGTSATLGVSYGR